MKDAWALADIMLGTSRVRNGRDFVAQRLVERGVEISLHHPLGGARSERWPRIAISEAKRASAVHQLFVRHPLIDESNL